MGTMGVNAITRPTPITNMGYWGLQGDGGVFTAGGAQFWGSLPGLNVIATDAVGIASTPTGSGYWIVRASGGGSIYTFGDAQFLGGGGLSNAVVGISAVWGPTQGYYFVDNQGFVGFGGSANFYGGGGLSGVSGIVSRPAGDGYWIITGGGAIHNYGSAPSLSLGVTPSSPVICGTSTPDGGGIILGDALGGVYAVGNANFQNSLPGISGTSSLFMTGIVTTGDSGGYWMVNFGGQIYAFGNAEALGGV